MNAITLLRAKEKYHSLVLAELGKSTAGLLELEQWKEDFSLELAKRYEASSSSDLYITHEELKQLMKWKLKKGKFRPSLQKLVNENDAENVVSVTKEAFMMVLNTKDSLLDEEQYIKLIRTALNILTRLRGVGPATASLLLSLLHTISRLAPPFYSDEAAYHVFQDSATKLKYSLAEYVKYLRIFYKMNPEFKHDFTDLEAGAWALELKEQLGLQETLSKDKAKEHKLDLSEEKPSNNSNNKRQRR